MNYHRYFNRAEKPVETCIAGCGAFGRSYLRQAQATPLLSARIAIDLSGLEAAEAWREIGIDPREIAVCESTAEIRTAWNAGRFIAAGDASLVGDLPIDVFIEATGHPEAGARHALMAVERGWHLALVSKEVDVVVGPGLSALARQNRCVVTPIDGDQPSLLMGLVTWAEVLGFKIVAAGKSSEYDFVFDDRSGMLSSNGRDAHVPELANLWSMESQGVLDVLSERSRVVSAFAQRTVPDLCELLIVANAVDLVPDRPDLHAPILHISEAPTAFSTVADGGLLGGERRIDIFNCLRKPDELSFAGGVFVVVRCEDPTSWEMLRQKGHIVSQNGTTALLYIPRHLLGLEAAISILEAGVHGMSSGAECPKPRFDLAIRAEADLQADTLLTATGHHHSIADTSGIAVPGSPLGPRRPVPYYLAANRRLLKPVAKGELIRCGDIEISEDSHLAKLRCKQDQMFFGQEAFAS